MFTYEELEECLAEERKEPVQKDESEQEKGQEKEAVKGAKYETEDQKQVREARIKRQCVILGAAALLFAGTATLSMYYENRTSSVTYYNIQTGENTAEHYGQGGELVEPGLRILTRGEEAVGEYNRDLLILVNKDHSLPEDFQVELTYLQNGSCAVASLMYDALSEMLGDGTREGLSFVVASGYRDTAKQQILLEEDIAATMEREGISYLEAYEKETRETMPPGYSEHETGLAVDLVSLHYQMLDERQEMTEENRWLREHCSEYGFILRYPKGKELVTGIDYESWHFRYVGEEAAKDIMKRGITLEEYLQEQD